METFTFIVSPRSDHIYILTETGLEKKREVPVHADQILNALSTPENWSVISCGASNSLTKQESPVEITVVLGGRTASIFALRMLISCAGVV